MGRDWEQGPIKRKLSQPKQKVAGTCSGTVGQGVRLLGLSGNNRLDLGGSIKVKGKRKGAKGSTGRPEEWRHGHNQEEKLRLGWVASPLLHWLNLGSWGDIQAVMSKTFENAYN